ncbi:hypothetical protein DDZ18_12430 [Marinicauda salina]|uniref:Methyltransferase domain-containing protein n=1 Tax=Marinicauda salina TaxID=2135793 RepID=A0A2U2BRF2_9PROT|nr:class I SAM-dependent methyltransferase [Marinicauda salina]PWE16569.1 hypothetical protein DDZ18_12430 [Marinicauda salina]
MAESYEKSWSDYWRDAGADAQAITGAEPGGALARYWRDFFLDEFGRRDAARVVDLASGAGVAAREAVAAASETGCATAVICSDISQDALAQAARSFPGPGVGYVVADAGRAPYVAGAFDLVVSQFGIEYAGLDALRAATDLVAPGGAAAFVAHLADGAIARECAGNLAVLDALQDAELVARVETLIDTAFRVDAGRADASGLAAAEQAVRDAAGRVSQVMEAQGPGGGAAFAGQLIPAMETLYQRRARYDRKDIAAWLSHQAGAIEAYAGRMRSMIEAAIDETEMAEIRAAFQCADFSSVEAEPMALKPEGGPAAWRFLARR